MNAPRAIPRNKVVLDAGWEGKGIEAGKLLRLYQYPITNCSNEEQRQGWMLEDERIRNLPAKHVVAQTREGAESR